MSNSSFIPVAGDYVRVKAAGPFQGKRGVVVSEFGYSKAGQRVTTLLGVRLDDDTQAAIERGQSAVAETDFAPDELARLR